MHIRFLDRVEERSRLTALFTRRQGTLAVLYGRRRCGKSRLIAECLPRGHAVSYVGDDREATLQRVSLAREIGRHISGFDRVDYPDWDSLLSRWWESARPGDVLALDEFPALVAAARELPSLLQKHIDGGRTRPVHLVLSGSSQQMMQGLVLDRNAPLYGRSDEILKIEPLRVGWIRKALRLDDPARAVEAFSVWGGVPRYWELAAEFDDLESAVSRLVLNQLGVLHDEPTMLLREDLRETAQAASILNLIGQGIHRLSEIAGRLAKPATSLSRPLSRLIELGLIQREVPFGAGTRDSKRTLYEIRDPFLRFWFRFVEPNYSMLEARREDEVLADVRSHFAQHVGGLWKELSRASVPHLGIHDREWGLASRWWGTGLDRRPMEVDVVAESRDGQSLLLGEVEWSRQSDVRALTADLERKASVFPETRGRAIHLAIWTREHRAASRRFVVVAPAQVLKALV